jgi:hypothetical protein
MPNPYLLSILPSNSCSPLHCLQSSRPSTIMVPFHYPRKGKSKLQHHLPHSQAFEHNTKRTRHSQEITTTEDPHAYLDTTDLETYTASLHRWTLRQLHTSFPEVRHSPPTHHSTSTTTTIVSPLYPTSSSLYNCSIRTPRLGDSGDEAEVLGDIDPTPCNTPKQRG